MSMDLYLVAGREWLRDSVHELLTDVIGRDAVRMVDLDGLAKSALRHFSSFCPQDTQGGVCLLYPPYADTLRSVLPTVAHEGPSVFPPYVLSPLVIMSSTVVFWPR